MNRLSRIGFTVVELLVVLAIIGVLMALLLPAVQTVREGARRTQCANHLKQIGSGALQHHTQWEYLPNAGGPWYESRKKAASGAPYLGNRQDWGVFYQILPFIEQKHVYENTDDHKVAIVAIKIYFCPSRRKPQSLPGAGEGSLSAGTLRGQIDYAGSGGSGPGIFPSGESFVNQNGVIIPRNNPSAGFINETLRVGNIKDGSSYTMMFGERNFNHLGNSQAFDENNGYINGWDWDTIRWSYQNPARDRRTTSNAADLRFGSSHPQGFNVTLADGSIRFIPFNIDLATFRALTVRNDGKSPQLQ